MFGATYANSRYYKARPSAVRTGAYLSLFFKALSRGFHEVFSFYATFMVSCCFTTETLPINIFDIRITATAQVHIAPPNFAVNVDREYFERYCRGVAFSKKGKGVSMRNNIVDIRTGKALFNDNVRNQLREGLRPHVHEGSEEQATTTVEQVLCTAIVGCVAALATKLATKLFDKFASAD